MPSDAPSRQRLDPPPSRGRLGAAVGTVTGARVVGLGLSVGVGVVLARSLGPGPRGELAVGVAASGVLAVALTAGLDVATLRSSGGGDLPAALRASRRRTAAAAGVVVLVAPVALFTGLAAKLGLTPTFFALSLLLTPLIVATQLYGNCALGIGQHARWAIATVANMLVYALGAAVVALTGLASPVTYLGALAVGYGAALAMLVRGVRRLGTLPRSTVRADDELRQSARGTAPTTVAQLALLRVPVPLLSALAGTAAAGILAVAMPLGEALLILPVAAGTVLLPTYRAHGHLRGRVHRHALTTALVSAGAGTVLCLVAPVLVPFVYGPEYADVSRLLLLLTPGFVVFAYGRVLQSSLQAGGRFFRVNAASVVGLATSLILQVVLTPAHGAGGAAVALSAGLVVTAAGLVVAHRGDASR